MNNANNIVLTKIEEILKQANLESALSLEALQQVVKLKEDFIKNETKIEELKKEVSNLTEKNRNLETKNSEQEKVINEFKAREKTLKDGEIKLLEENFKLKYFQSRGDEMKEILGMALRNTEIRRDMFKNSNINTTSSDYNKNSNEVHNSSESITESAK